MNYQKIALIIQRQCCPRHKAKPIAVANCSSIELHCCCYSFEEEIKKQIIREKELQNLENIENFLMGKSS
ncbi:MAG: hypothetical protein WCL06_06025 [Bacteroidota bacterium]